MSRFTFSETPLKGLTVLKRYPVGDDRGYLERLFCCEELEPVIGDRPIVQINHTLTRRAGTVRGMHFQHPPHAEMKLVTCLRGEVFDVAVDLRSGSPTFLHWHAERLGADTHQTLAIPEGFAHGFQTLTDDCELLYLHTAAYRPEAEDGVNALDPRIDIRWPWSVAERSDRDCGHSLLDSAYSGIRVS
jgi:dTDP-4-dehydrorhamnose 3,5-epimerase